MIYKRVVQILIGTGVSFFLFAGITFAQVPNVTVADETAIYLEGVGRTVYLLTSSNALDEVRVNAGGLSFTITTNLTSGTVKVRSNEGLNMGDTYNTLGTVLTSCDQNGSILTVQANINSVVTVTVTPPLPTDPKLLCVALSPAQAPASQGPGPAGPPPPSPSPSPPSTPPPPPPGEPTVEKPEGMFKDVPGKLSKVQADSILQVVDLMLDKKTYVVPKNRVYGVNTVTTNGFAIEIGLAVAGKNCGSSSKFPGLAACKKAAQKAKLVTSGLNVKSKMNRAAYYKLLLKGIGQKLVNATVKDLKASCADAKSISSKNTAQVFLTAQELGIVSIYPGNKCKLTKTFSRKEAAVFAKRALDALSALSP